MKNFGNNTNKWKDTPHSWIGRINIIKISVLSNAIYRFSAIPIKIPRAVFTNVEEAIL